MQRQAEGAKVTEAIESDGLGIAKALATLGAVKPDKSNPAESSRHAAGSEFATKLVLPALTPAQRRRRIAFKVAAVLSLALHAGSLYAFLAWRGTSDMGALDSPSEAISVEIVASRTLEATQPQQSSEPAPSPDSTAPVEGKTEASDAKAERPEPKEAQPEVTVPQPPVVIPDAAEEVMRTIQQETPAKSEAPPLPVEGPAEVVPPPPKSGDSDHNAPAKRTEQKQVERKKAAQPAPKGGITSKSSAGKGTGRRARVGKRRVDRELCGPGARARRRQQAFGRRDARHCCGLVWGDAVRRIGLRRPRPLLRKLATRSAGRFGRAWRSAISLAPGRGDFGAAAVLDPVPFPISGIERPAKVDRYAPPCACAGLRREDARGRPPACRAHGRAATSRGWRR